MSLPVTKLRGDYLYSHSFMESSLEMAVFWSLVLTCIDDDTHFDQ